MPDKTTFVKSFSAGQMKLLKSHDLYQQKILPDILSGKVFPAIRRNRIDFYHGGGKLFSFTSEFSTHLKYASVFTYDKNYLSESTFSLAKPITNFIEGYDQIKENCRLYSGVEANGVSKVYANSSFMHCEDNVVVLDIEASMKSVDNDSNIEGDGPSEKNGVKKRKQDRVDLLFFNKKNKTLKFYEAKHFSNKELWAEPGSKPEVVKQIGRYEKQLGDKEGQIISAYQDYVKIMNALFDVELPLPQHLDPEVTILVFGYDAKQEKKINELLIEDNSLEGLSLRTRGNCTDKKFSAETLSKKVKRY